jgi:acetoin utilization deacetylase AcuC-like enzyme
MDVAFFSAALGVIVAAMRTALVIDDRFQAHDPGPGHPESPARIRAILDALAQYQRSGLVRLDPRPATVDELALVHAPSHIAHVAATAGRPRYAFDADTPTSARSFDTALLAAGGYLALVEAIMAGEVENGFAFVRPPGHHAEPDRAMGFCLFNNVAIAARHLQQRFGIRRVLIVDWDVHHGNGTQDAFFADPDVLYVSTHQYPFYPGTGGATEVGGGAGAGRTLNVPFPAGCGDDEYIAAFTDVIVPIAAQFRPEFVLVSAGFDAHRRDPLAAMTVTDEGFRAMARLLVRLAEQHADGRLAAILEGGYDLRALQTAIPAVLDEFGGVPAGAALARPQPRPGVLDATRAAQRPFWDVH